MRADEYLNRYVEVAVIKSVKRAPWWRFWNRRSDVERETIWIGYVARIGYDHDRGGTMELWDARHGRARLNSMSFKALVEEFKRPVTY